MGKLIKELKKSVNAWEYFDTLAKMPDVQVVAATIWGEARGEGITGMVGVGKVIENRAQRNAWPDHERQVCLQAWQFSVWNAPSDLIDNFCAALKALNETEGDLSEHDFDPNTDTGALAWALDIAFRVLNDAWDSAPAGIKVAAKGHWGDHYHTKQIKKPDWARGAKPSKRHGNHIFYSLSQDD